MDLPYPAGDTKPPSLFPAKTLATATSMATKIAVQPRHGRHRFSIAFRRRLAARAARDERVAGMVVVDRRRADSVGQSGRGKAVRRSQRRRTRQANSGAGRRAPAAGRATRAAAALSFVLRRVRERVPYGARARGHSTAFGQVSASRARVRTHEASKSTAIAVIARRHTACCGVRHETISLDKLL